jgi:hypothetical protein
MLKVVMVGQHLQVVLAVVVELVQLEQMELLV